MALTSQESVETRRAKTKGKWPSGRVGLWLVLAGMAIGLFTSLLMRYVGGKIGF